MAAVFTKAIFKRARPLQIKEFGGDYDFTPAFYLGQQCLENCSFVSSHAAVGFIFCSLVHIIPEKHNRLRMSLFAIILGLLLGMVRIAEGKHFLSDVVFSGFLIFGLSWIFYKLFLDNSIFKKRIFE